jgi:hypothetical protein
MSLTFLRLFLSSINQAAVLLKVHMADAKYMPAQIALSNAAPSLVLSTCLSTE